MCLSHVSRNWGEKHMHAETCIPAETATKNSKMARVMQWKKHFEAAESVSCFSSEEKEFKHKLKLTKKWQVGTCKLQYLLNIFTVLQPSTSSVNADIWFPSDTSRNIWIPLFNTASSLGLTSQPVLRIAPSYAWTAAKFWINLKLDPIQHQSWMEEVSTPSTSHFQDYSQGKKQHLA